MVKSSLMIKKLVTSVQEENLYFIASLILLMHPHTSTDGVFGKNNNNNLNSQIVKLFERDCMQSVHSSSTICRTMRPQSTLCGACQELVPQTTTWVQQE